MLTSVPDTFPAGLGEPLNMIIAGTSDEDVLNDSVDNGGLQNYFQSFGFSGECLGLHQGDHQAADLGDGNGYKNETQVMRWNYGDPKVGTCTETVKGGNHFRYWTQNGPNANSGAIFMAVSYELPVEQQHNIIVNGYDLGRDWLVGNITGQAIPTLALANTTHYAASQTSANNYTYQTDVQYMSGLLQSTSEGINHFLTVGVNGGPAIDGFVAVLNVKITGTPSPASTSPSSTPTPSPTSRSVALRSKTLPILCGILSLLALLSL